MTHAEHAERIHRTLLTLERAMNAHHAALAAYAAEHGAQNGVSGEITTQAAAPKLPPNND